MKYRAIGIIALIVMILLVFVGVATLDRPEEIIRYHQHEQSRSLEDLDRAEMGAASSSDISLEGFASHLPVVSITTGGQEIPGRPLYGDNGRLLDEQGTWQKTLAADGTPTISVHLVMYNNEASKSVDMRSLANRLSDEPEFETMAEMRIRGHSSSNFYKPSYRLTFTLDDRITPNPQNVLGMGYEQDWVLHGPFLDKSLIRNYIAMNLFGRFMPYTPDVRFIELFLNGQYQGLYLLMETIKHDENRVNIEDSDPNSANTSFLVTRDWRHSTDGSRLTDFMESTYRSTSTGTEIAYPNVYELTEAQREWIEDCLNQVEKSVYSYDYDTPSYGYWNYIDVDSFVDYALISEISINEDAGKFSTWLYQDFGGKLCMGPLWDFNNAFDNGFEQSIQETGFVMLDKPIYSMLFRDEQFTEKVIERYRELRRDLLSDETVSKYIDAVVDYLSPAIKRNYEVWGYTIDPDVIPLLDTDQRLEPIVRNPTSHDEAVSDLKDSFLKRMAWLDNNIETLKQYSHESAVKGYNH